MIHFKRKTSSCNGHSKVKAPKTVPQRHGKRRKAPKIPRKDLQGLRTAPARDTPRTTRKGQLCYTRSTCVLYGGVQRSRQLSGVILFRIPLRRSAEQFNSVMNILCFVVLKQPAALGTLTSLPRMIIQQETVRTKLSRLLPLRLTSSKTCAAMQD